MDETLRSLENLVRDTIQTEGFRLQGPFSERHGSWEVTCTQDGSLDGLARFVSLALTEMSDSCEIEVRAGAEQGNRYVRKRAEMFAVGCGRLTVDETLKRIVLGLRRAIQTAKELQTSGLTEVYLLGSAPMKVVSANSAAYE
jgi:hypothetical protein